MRNHKPSIVKPLHTTAKGDSVQSESSTTMLGRRWIRWVLLLSVTLIAFAAVLIPALVIQPFKLQTAERLSLSYSLRHWSPIITLIALAFALLIVVSLWNRSRGWWRKGLLVSFFIPLLLATWFARQNHFEWMFKPLPNAAFAKVNDAGFVADGDMVLAVELNGDSAAYPVRQIAYHHVVQDTIGGIPVLVTY
jgi:hypothetical protein